MFAGFFERRASAEEFSPEALRSGQLPSPLPRAVIHALLALLAAMLVWVYFGRLDVVAVAQGRLVPQSFLKIVQPAEGGIVREILVREGQAVREGEVLIRMDRRFAEADLNTLSAELARRELQLRRIEAELSGAPLARKAGDPPGWFEQVEAQYRARRRALEDALEAERAVLAKARRDLAAALEIEAKLRQTAPIYREQARAWEQLAKDGFAGRLLALDRQRSSIEAEQDLAAQRHAVEGLKATIAQAEKRIAQIESGYRQQLHDERIEAEAARAKFAQEFEKQRHRHALLEVKAPHAGVVKDLATHTPGTVVAPGTILLTLVPHDEPLVAEVWVSNADAGFVEAGQRARVKLAAYPFQKYGMLEGRVEQLSADARERADSIGARPPAEAAYRALIRLESNLLESGGRRLRLVPGMLASAEIHLGTRSVLEYLLSPVRKVVHEAGRER
jgi:HlyD family secretion protein